MTLNGIEWHSLRLMAVGFALNDICTAFTEGLLAALEPLAEFFAVLPFPAIQAGLPADCYYLPFNAISLAFLAADLT